MTPIIYNASVAVGILLIAVGMWLRSGYPTGMIAAGSALLALTVFGRWIER